MKTLIIDSTNYSKYMARGYSVSYNEVTGPNTCVTLDGKKHTDVIATKVVLTVNLKPLKQNIMSSILQLQGKKCTVKYFDIKDNIDKTTIMQVKTNSASLILDTINTLWGNGNSGISLVLEEL